MKYTYPGDCTNYDPTAYIGGNGRFYRPTAATYHPDTNTTTIEYQPIPMDQMPTYGADKLEQAHDRARLIDLFGGHW